METFINKWSFGVSIMKLSSLLIGVMGLRLAGCGPDAGELQRRWEAQHEQKWASQRATLEQQVRNEEREACDGRVAAIEAKYAPKPKPAEQGYKYPTPDQPVNSFVQALLSGKYDALDDMVVNLGSEPTKFAVRLGYNSLEEGGEGGSQQAGNISYITARIFVDKARPDAGTINVGLSYDRDNNTFELSRTKIVGEEEDTIEVGVRYSGEGANPEWSSVKEVDISSDATGKEWRTFYLDTLVGTRSHQTTFVRLLTELRTAAYDGLERLSALPPQ